ncbi:hypothetical protein [Streptomyces sp. NPDC059979]|uniref:hypothetical protein n=1 Tax=Streptomyces sp. NPDC059979 TaxID=3347021 RepID=UPI0036CDE9CE
MRSVTAAAGAAAVLAGLITAAGPASAAAGATACTPSVDLLPALPGPAGGTVAGFGPDGLAVGESGGRPAYWTGPEHTVHAVPLPAGFEQGSIKAVSAKGLMVGSATRTSDRAAVAFTHQIGSATSEALTTPAAGQSAVDVDVNASGRVVAVDNGVAKEWVNGKAVRELPVPADAIPGTRIVSLTGINKRGDIVGTATGSYFDAENDIEVTKTFPVVWPAGGGGYPPYSLQVWNGYHSSFSTIGRDIDDRGTVVGLEHYHYRNDPTRTPAVWKKPYDALPADPGRLGGHRDLELSGSSPTTNVAVGTATTFEESWPSYFQAVYWTGKGAPLALPHPTGSTGDTLSRAFAATDDDRVGGAVVDRNTQASTAVIWNCASKQAYAPRS